MPLKSRDQKKIDKDDEIVKTEQRLLVHEAILNGKSIAALARETGIAEFILRERKSEVQATLTQAFHDELEWARTEAAVRLEKIYQAAEPWGYGRIADSKGELKDTDIPDRQWLKFMTEVILAKLKIYTDVEERFRERQEQGKQNLNFTRVQNLTLVAGQDMFEHARTSQWMKYHDFAPEQLEAMLMDHFGDVDVSKLSPKDLSAQVEKLAKVILTEQDSAEEDTEEDDQ